MSETELTADQIEELMRQVLEGELISPPDRNPVALAQRHACAEGHIHFVGPQEWAAGNFNTPKIMPRSKKAKAVLKGFSELDKWFAKEVRDILGEK